jgi:hypothetical protein
MLTLRATASAGGPLSSLALGIESEGHDKAEAQQARRERSAIDDRRPSVLSL